MKTNPKINISKLISVLIISVFLCSMLSISVSANTNGPTLLRQDQLDNTAGTFLDKKVRLMVDSNVLDVQKSNARKLKSASLDKEASLIVDFRREMSSLGETYINPKSELEVISQRVGEDGNLYVVANETTTLTIAENGVETGYSANHEFVYSKDDDQWVLIEDRQLEPTGLLPLYQAEEFVYHGQGDIKSNKELETNPSSESSENLTERINLIPEIEASTDRKNNINKDTKSDNAKSTSLRAPGGYNYSAMAAYLEKYWKNYNKSYRDFSKNGGDCTNFVSQALKAGGWQHKSGYYKNSNYWWYNSTNQSYSWINVDYLGSFARSSGRCKMLDNVWKLRVGDFLQVKGKNSSSKDHSMMVSYFKNGTPYFTYHSNNRYRRSMNQVLSDWPGGTFYAYRT